MMKDMKAEITIGEVNHLIEQYLGLRDHARDCLYNVKKRIAKTGRGNVATGQCRTDGEILDDHQDQYDLANKRIKYFRKLLKINGN